MKVEQEFNACTDTSEIPLDCRVDVIDFRGCIYKSLVFSQEYQIELLSSDRIIGWRQSYQDADLVVNASSWLGGKKPMAIALEDAHIIFKDIFEVEFRCNHADFEQALFNDNYKIHRVVTVNGNCILVCEKAYIFKLNADMTVTEIDNLLSNEI